MSLGDRLRPRRVLVLALGTMVVTAATAAWLLGQLAVQDRTLQRQRYRERLDSAADVVTADLGARLTDMEKRLDERLSGPDRVSAAPDWLGSDALLVGFAEDGVRSDPPGRLF